MHTARTSYLIVAVGRATVQHDLGLRLDTSLIFMCAKCKYTVKCACAHACVMRVCARVRARVYTCTYVCARACVRACTCLQACMRSCMRVYLLPFDRVCVFVRACIRALVRAFMRAGMHLISVIRISDVYTGTTYKLHECINIALPMKSCCSRPFHSRIHCKLMIFSSSFQTCRAVEVILHSFVHFIIYRYSLYPF